MNSENTKNTFRLELGRSCLAGVIEAAASTFFLLIAVRWFHASPFAKGVLSSGNSMGYLLAPAAVWFTRRFQLSVKDSAALLFVLSGILLFAGFTATTAAIFIITATGASALYASTIPLLTGIYERNYPAERRGKLVSRCFMVRIGLAMISSYYIGIFLNARLEDWGLVIAGTAFAYCLSGALVNRYPAHRISGERVAGMRAAFRAAKEDILFRNTLISWMFLGFGNLMMVPLRVEYLANPIYGISLATSQIALFCGVVPNAVRLLANPIWGYLFDNINFFVLRIILNFGFLIGIGAFFFGTSPVGFFMGAVLLGIASSGGDVAWNLWVTKIAAPEKVPGYMAVHTFFTGVRGVLAPITGFMLLGTLSIQALSWLAMVLILIAIILLWFEILKGRSLTRDEYIEPLNTNL